MADTLRVLVADKLAEQGVEYLRQFEDIEVDVKTGLSEEDLAATVGAYDGLVVRSGAQVTASVLADPGRLRAIARAGVGVDNIDLDAATAAGVLVMNSADASTITTAEHAMALMLALARNVGPAYRTMADGGWDRNRFLGTQLADKTLGIVGFGRIGRTVAERALAFEMNVVAYDPIYNVETELDGRVRLYRDFDQMLSELDVITFHVPLNDHTRGMLNAERFKRCRDGLLLVNAARGGLVDIPALIDALDSGKCAGAAIDVYETEPPPTDDPLRSHPNVLLTPHLGASTAEAQEAVSVHACQQIVEYLRGEGIRGAVNAAGVRLDLDPQQMRYVDLAQRMAQLVLPMCDEGIADITVRLCDPALTAAADTIERLAVVELLKGVLDVPVNVVNVKLLAEQRSIATRVVSEDGARGGARLALEIQSGDEARLISGTIGEEGRPRVLRIGRYAMDMVPTGAIIVIMNEDRPGMIGLVGTELGNAGVNIADMAISRHHDTALMVVKADGTPDDALIAHLRQCPGILKVVTVTLPELRNGDEDD